MTEDKKTNEKPLNDRPVKPVVNEKVKYYLIAVVILLCIITTLVVVFSPEAMEKRNAFNENIVQILI